MARLIADSIKRQGGEAPAVAQLRAAGEELQVLDPLSRAIYHCKTWEVQTRLCEEIKDALLRAIAHVDEAKRIIEQDPVLAFAPPSTPSGKEPSPRE